MGYLTITEGVASKNAGSTSPYAVAVLNDHTYTCPVEAGNKKQRIALRKKLWFKRAIYLVRVIPKPRDKVQVNERFVRTRTAQGLPRDYDPHPHHKKGYVGLAIKVDDKTVTDSYGHRHALINVSRIPPTTSKRPY